MSRYSSPFAPIDRDSARLADELRTIAQDDTRRAPRLAGPRRAGLRRLLRFRPARLQHTPRTP